MKTCLKKSGPKQLIYRSYKKFHLNLFKSELSSKLTSNTELSYSHFNESLQTLLEKHAPLKSKFVRANEVPYMTKSWRKAIMTRSRLKNEYLKNPTPFNWMKYKRQRNLCVSLNRRSRREYFSMLDCKNQQTVKSILELWLQVTTPLMSCTNRIVSGFCVMIKQCCQYNIQILTINIAMCFFMSCLNYLIGLFFSFFLH